MSDDEYYLSFSEHLGRRLDESAAANDFNVLLNAELIKQSRERLFRAREYASVKRKETMEELARQVAGFEAVLRKIDVFTFDHAGTTIEEKETVNDRNSR